ncbi:hypothetical protein BDA96_09G126900 [Sorghum bicolor]|uniref:Uncharacterized protein n=1 Tax=Sorghum bicolor TaxID=4558 RepID=A0A921U4E1_SORBI|nr:hypothetical protein BDA96_09G126900 [Sorghum bicolor]
MMLMSGSLLRLDPSPPRSLGLPLPPDRSSGDNALAARTPTVAIPGHHGAVRPGPAGRRRLGSRRCLLFSGGHALDETLAASSSLLVATAKLRGCFMRLKPINNLQPRRWTDKLLQLVLVFWYLS